MHQMAPTCSKSTIQVLNIVWYLLKFNNEDTRTTDVILVFLLLTLKRFHKICSGVSIVDFEQVNVGWKLLGKQLKMQWNPSI